MIDNTWKIIRKERHPQKGKELVLKVSKTKRGSIKLILSVPLYIRKKSDYFKTRKMYCNLMEKGSLVMIQFIPEKAKTIDSSVLYNGTLWLPPYNFRSYLDPQNKRIEVLYHLDNGNIIIDREKLKTAKNLEETKAV